MKKRTYFYFLLLIVTITLFGQFGFASQLLTVDGKIEIKDDSQLATEGAIRYDSTVKDFEGYDGNQWNSFTMSGGMLPSGAIPMFSSVNVLTDGSYETFTIREMAGANSDFTTVPVGKNFIVTSASFTGPANGATVNKNYTIRISGSTDATGEVIWIQGRFENGHLSSFTNGFAPLIIIEPGEYLRAQHPNFVDDNASVNVFIRGWLVDDLNF